MLSQPRSAGRDQAAQPLIPTKVRKSAPIVSIGLYVHNGEPFLEQTLVSILAQTFADFELIISDNASTDRTAEIAQAYAARDPRIRYYRAEHNMGGGWNMRRVLVLATGKYFKWAAADDVLMPDFLRRCVDVLDGDPGCVLAHTQTTVIDENSAPVSNYVTPVKANSSDPVARFRVMLLIPSWCYEIFGVMRMAALKQVPPPGSYVNSDGVLLAQMALLGRFYEVPEYLFRNRHHSARSAVVLPVRVTQPRFRLTRRYSTLPSPEWWDPAKTRAVTFPEWRQLREYFLSVHRAPLTHVQKLRCYFMLLPWTKIHLRPLLKDCLIAADQLLYNWQAARRPAPHDR